MYRKLLHTSPSYFLLCIIPAFSGVHFRSCSTFTFSIARADGGLRQVDGIIGSTRPSPDRSCCHWPLQACLHSPVRWRQRPVVAATDERSPHAGRLPACHYPGARALHLLRVAFSRRRRRCAAVHPLHCQSDRAHYWGVHSLVAEAVAFRSTRVSFANERKAWSVLLNDCIPWCKSLTSVFMNLPEILIFHHPLPLLYPNVHIVRPIEFCS